MSKHPFIGQEAFWDISQILESGTLSAFRGTPDWDMSDSYVRRLEVEFEAFFGVKHAVALNSATSGLHAALIACGIGVGDEVIVSPYSFSASASCVKMVGATPVFVDIQPDIFCISPSEIFKAITPKTRAIIPVHLMGHPAAMDSIMGMARRHGIKVIEDSAQAIGATFDGHYTGTMGDCGIFSFNQSKPVSCGEGGMLVTNDDYIARIARGVRNHGEVSDPELGIIGYNYRMCEIEAAIVLEQFRKLNKINDYRIMLTDYMTERLGRFEELTPPVTYPNCKHVFYTYAVKYRGDRDSLQKRLMDRGVYWGKGYVKPLYLLPVFGGKLGDCPVAERMWREIMVFDWLRYPTTKEDIDRTIEILEECLNDQIVLTH